MQCRYCGCNNARVRREYNHQKKKWETVAVCHTCGRSFLTESSSSSCFIPFVEVSLTIISILCLSAFFMNRFPKLEIVNIVIAILVTIIAILIINYRRQVAKGLFLIIKFFAIKILVLIKKGFNLISQMFHKKKKEVEKK